MTKILAIAPDKYGVGKFRIIDPYMFIDSNYDDVHVDITMNAENNDEYFKNYDVVVFHSFIHQTTHDENINRINFLKREGIKVIMDIDDLWFVDQRHPMYYQFTKSQVGRKKIDLLNMVDYVTTTTPIFKKIITEKLGLKNVIVFPNAIDPTESQFIPQPTKSELIRFGWLGGSSHLYDIELLRDAFQLLSPKENNVQFVLCGFDINGTINEVDRTTGKIKPRNIKPLETVWYKYETIFTNNYKTVTPSYKDFLHKFVREEYDKNEQLYYIRKWTESINKYATNYNHFDVSLAPLVKSDFNSCKSQLKVIEAGFHKKALIASNVDPYRLDLVSAIDNGKYTDKGNCLLVDPSKNHKQWGKYIKKIASNPSMIEDLGNRLYETVKDKYSMKVVCNERYQFLNNLK
jgi:glycosyltransferase involved in cell wall biosynthesis